MKITFSVLGRLLGAVLVLAFNPSVTHAQFVGTNAITIDGTFSDWTGNVYSQTDLSNPGANAGSAEDITKFWYTMSTASGGTSPASTSNLIQNVYFRFDTGNPYANNPQQAYWVQLNLGTAGPGFADHILEFYVDTSPSKGDPIVKIVLYSYSTPYPGMGAFTDGTIIAKVSNLSSKNGTYDTNATGSYAINGGTYSFEAKIPIAWYGTNYGGSITADGTGASMIASAMFTSSGKIGSVGTVKDVLDDASGNTFYSQQSATIGSVSFVAGYSGGNAYSAAAAAATNTPVAGAADTITLTVQKNNGGGSVSTDTTYTGAHNVIISGYSAAPNGSYGSFSNVTLTTLSQTISVTFTNGVATPSLILNNAATQIIGFSLPDLTYPAANNLTITPTAGTASKLAYTNSVVTVTAGVASGNITVQRQDQYGNPVTAEGTRTVTLSSDSTGTKTFNPTSLSIATNTSSASFTYTDTKAGTPTITAASTSPSTITSATQQETVNAAAASQLVFTSTAVTNTAGVASSSITVQRQDQYNNPNTADAARTVTLASDSTGTVTFNPTSLTIASGSSSASFTYTDTKAGTPTITAASTSPTTITSATQQETVNPAAASQLVFTSTAVTNTAGVASSSITVQRQDQFGNTNTTDAARTVTLSSSSSGTVTFNPTSLTIASGSSSASFTYTDTQAGTPTITAASTSPSTITSATQQETVNAAAASKLVFTSTAVTTTAGVASSSITVQRQDQYNNPNTTDASRTVTLSSDSTGTKTFTPASPLTIANGSSTATFTYTDTKAGTPTITAASTSPSTITSATQQETVNAAAASQLVVTTQPSASTVAGVAFATQPVVTIEDAFGNVLTSGSDSTVSVALTLTTGTGSLGGTASMAAVNGVADFTGKGLNINLVGTDKVLTATATVVAGTKTTTTSPAFTITFAAASQLVFTSMAVTTTAGVASGSITVQRQDQYGNPTTAGTTNVTLSSSSSGTVTFTPASPVSINNGSSSVSFTYTDTKAGTPTITAANSGLTSGTQAETVNAAAASKLVFTSTAVTTTAGVASTSITVQRQDQYNNPNTADAARTVTLASDSTGTVTFTPASPLTIASGASSASFTYTDTKAGTPTITAASTLPSTITSATQQETVNAAAASQLVFTTQPSASTVAGVAFAQQPVVKIEDQFGNVVTTGTDSTVSVALTLTTGTGSLGGTASMDAVAGVANFTGKGLNIDLVGADKVLTATATVAAGTKTTTTSPAFAITFAAASQVVFTTQPGNGTGGTAFTTQPAVTLQDAYGNTVTGTAQDVTLAIQNNAGSGTLSGTMTVAVNTSTGVATFSGLSIDKAGNGYTLTATGSAVNTTAGVVVSSGFNIIAGTLDHFAVTTPGTQTAGTAFAIATITAQDANNNTVSGFTGTVDLTETGSGAGGTVSPATSSAFTAGVLSGQSVTLSKSGTLVTITATDHAGTLKNGVSGTFLVNPGPMAMPMTVTRTAGLTLKIAWSDVKTNWSESDGGTVTLSGINLVTTNQVHLTTNSTWIFYINSPNVNDQITYTISDSQGRTNPGVINVVINPFVTGQDATVTVSNNMAIVTFYGKPTLTYVTQRATDLDLVNWVSIATNTVSSSGVINVTDNFSDLGGNIPISAYYRLGWSP